MAKSKPSSDDAFNDSLSFVKKLWGGMNVPGMTMPGMPSMPGMTMPTMSLDELDKRIGELKSVETWLNMNVSMLQNSIKALEIQRATIATLHSLSSTMSQTMQSSEEGDKKKGDVAPNPASAPDVAPLMAQSAAWWNTVQEQFKQALSVALAKSAENAEAVKSASEKVKTPVTKRATARTTRRTTEAGTKPSKTSKTSRPS